MIRLADEYLFLLYDYFHRLLYEYYVIQADETPVLVNKDGRPAGSKSYMWVYRTGKYQTDRQVILYDYQKTRKTDHPREFLKDFRGVCVSESRRCTGRISVDYDIFCIQYLSGVAFQKAGD